MILGFSVSPRLARAPLNSAAPFLEDRFRSVTAELDGYARARWWRSFAPHRVSFLPRLSVCGEEDEGERTARVFNEPKRPAAGAEAGANKGDASCSKLFVRTVTARKHGTA